MQAGHGPLQFALGLVRNSLAHQAVDRGLEQSLKGTNQNRDKDQPALIRSGDQIGDGADGHGKRADNDRIAFADLRDQQPDQQTLNKGRADADTGQRQPDHQGAPAEILDRVKGKDDRIDNMADHPHRQRRRVPDDDAILAAQSLQRDKRIGSPDLERPPLFRGQAFAQHEKAEDQIGCCQTASGKKGQACAIFAQQPAQRRSEYEAETEGGSDQPEILRAPFRWGNICDIGIGSAEARSHDPGHDPGDKQPQQRSGKAHQNIGDRIAAERAEQHRAAPETVGQVPHHRPEDELHPGIGKGEPAGVHRSGRQTVAGNLGDQFRQHRHDDAKAEHVDQHDEKDEDQRGPGGGWGVGFDH